VRLQPSAWDRPQMRVKLDRPDLLMTSLNRRDGRIASLHVEMEKRPRYHRLTYGSEQPPTWGVLPWSATFHRACNRKTNLSGTYVGAANEKTSKIGLRPVSDTQQSRATLSRNFVGQQSCAASRLGKLPNLWRVVQRIFCMETISILRQYFSRCHWTANWSLLVAYVWIAAHEFLVLFITFI